MRTYSCDPAETNYGPSATKERISGPRRTVETFPVPVGTQRQEKRAGHVAALVGIVGKPCPDYLNTYRMAGLFVNEYPRLGQVRSVSAGSVEVGDMVAESNSNTLSVSSGDELVDGSKAYA